MKLHQYNEMMRYLTRRPKKDPSIKQLAASNPLGFPEHMIHQYEGGQLTPEEFYQHQSIPQSERPLTGAEGGRVQYKPGGLVEPGVMYYGKTTSHEKAALNRKKFIEWLGDRKKLDYNTYKKAVKRIFDQPVSSVTHKLRTRYPEILKGVEFTNMPPGGGKFYEATRLTLKEAANIQKNLPENIHLTAQYKNGKPTGIYHYNLKIRKKGKPIIEVYRPFLVDENVNAKAVKELTNIRDKTYRKWYPNSITENEFKKLRLKKENIKLSNEAFAKKLGNRTSSFGDKFNQHSVYSWQKKIGINEQVGAFTHRTIPEVKEIIKKSDGGDYILKRYNDGFMTDSALRKISHGILKAEDLESRIGRFPVSGDNATKKWYDLFRAANKGNRIKIVGEFADPENYPKDANGKINWKKVDKDGIPAWKKIKFVDTESPKPNHRFTFNNLSSQVDDVFGKGSWNQFTQVYDEIKRLNLLELPDGRKVSGILNVELAKRDLRNKLTKEAGKPVSEARLNKEWKTYAKGKMQGYSLIQGHHPFGVGKNPWVVEAAFRDANLNLQSLDESLRAGNLPFKEYIRKAKALPGNIRFPHPESGKIIGTKATARTIFTAAGEATGLDKNKAFVNWIKKFPCRKSNGGVVDLNCHIEGMRREKNLLNTGKGTKAMANKFIEGTSLASKGKFGNASRLFLKGTVVGDLLFEGAYAAYNATQGKDSADIWRHSWYSFMDPKLWKDGKYIGWVKDADQAKLYTRKDGSIMPEIKRYVDNANLVQKHLDLYNNVFSASLQDPTIQVGAVGEASKKVTQAKTDLDLFNEEIYKTGGMNKIIGELERDYKTYSEREEVMAGREEQVKKDWFEKARDEWGAFPKDREFHDMSDVERKRKYDQRYKDMEAANPLKSVFSSPEMMADYFVSDDMAQEYLKKYFPLSYGHVSSKRMLPSAKQDVFRLLREDPEYNQYIHSMASAYDPTLQGTQYNTGGRVGFKAGGFDKGRRAFMKWLAGITGAGIATGTGLLKWGKVAGKGKTAVQVGDKIIQSTQGMPDWFIPLVNRVVKEGDDVTKKLGTVEREIVHTKKIGKGEEATVYQNLDTGNVRVDYDSPHNLGEGIGPVSLEYSAPQVIDEGKHAGKKTNPEFEAYEPEPVGYTHGPDDYAIEWDGTNIVGRAEDLVSDTSKLKEFAIKKKPTMKEIVIRKKKKDQVNAIHKDESDYIATKQGEGEWDDYLPDIDDMDY